MPWFIDAHRFPLASACAALCLLAGCAAKGPNFSPPDPAVPAQWSTTQAGHEKPHAAAQNAIDVQAEPDPQWWHRFNDPLLDSLEERAVAGNLDLKEAVVRIAASRSQEQIARAQGLPNLNASASYDREQLGLEGVIKANGGLPPSLKNNPTAVAAESQLTQPVNLFTVALDSSWELDLFGKVARSVEAAGAQTEADKEARSGALASLEAEVAQTYVQLRTAQSLRALTRSILEDQRQTLELTKSLQSNGLGRQADVEALEAQLAQNEAQLPPYEVQIAQAGNALAVLIGATPGSLNAELAEAGDGKIFALPNTVAIGLPASLARRRPDIRQAEANLHAATAQTGVAIASLFPDVSLSAQYGVRNTSTKYLFNWASRFYTVGPSVSLPIFQGGALTANVHLARAEQEAAALEYRKTVLNALSEVENALVALDQDQAKSDALRRTVEASDRSLTLARHAYHGGLATFITVLDGQRQSAQAKVQLASALAQQSTDLVTLYKALGGGWEWQPLPTAEVSNDHAQN